MQHSYDGLDRPGGLSRVHLLAPLRHRQFRLLWSAMTISLVGDGIFFVAIAWEAYELWNAPAALSIVGIGMTVPTIAFLLLGGAISDRLDRRVVMLASDVVRMVVMSVLAVHAWTGTLSYWHLVGLVAVYGAATAFFTPAFEAIVPDIVPRRDLAAANSLDQLVRPVAFRLAGPAVGGWIVATLGVGAAFAADALSFVLSAAVLLVMRPPPHPRTEHAESTVKAIKEGLGFVVGRVWLWGTLAAAALSYLVFLGPAEVLLPYLVKNELAGSAGELGLVFAAGGVGAVGAAMVLGQRGLPRRDITYMYACWTLATLAVAGYGLAASSWQLMVACLVFNALETGGTIIWVTVKQRHVPAALLGRVSSLDWLISVGLLPLSFALTAPVAGVLGARGTLMGAAIVGGAITLGALFLPGMRAIEGGSGSESNPPSPRRLQPAA